MDNETLRRRIHARRRRRAVFRTILMGMLVAALIVLAVRLVQGGEETGETEAASQTATVELGDITKSVFGSGSILPVSQPTVKATTTGQVQKIAVELGDSVQAGDVLVQLYNDELEAEIAELSYQLQLAQQEVEDTETYTQYVYRQLYDDDGEPRFDANTGEAITGKYSNEISIRAPGAGRVMAIYIEAGDDALAVYRDKGAVMLLSTDGRMKVELTDLNGQLLALGDSVQVTGKNVDTEGVVVSLTRQGTQATIQIMGDTYAMDTPVTVSTLDGELVGEGTLEINKPLAVSAYGGTIKGLTVNVGDEVERDEVLARLVWDESPLYLDNDEVLRAYAKAKVAYEEAVSKRDALTIVAPCDGRVASISASVGDDVKSGTLLLTLVEDAGMSLTLSVDELDIIAVQAGQTVNLSADALPDAELTGTVEKIAPLGNTQTGVTTYDVYIALDTVDERVMGGMNISGEITVEERQDVLLIPTEALKKDAQGYYVTREDGSQARVTLGIMTDDQSQVTSGLSQGDVIVY